MGKCNVTEMLSQRQIREPTANADYETVTNSKSQT